MQDIAVLLMLCVATAVGTFFSGIMPLFVPLSQRGLRQVEYWGAGLLIGAALTVVIPEGISSIYQGRHCDEYAPRKGKPRVAAVTPSLMASRDLVATCLLGGYLLMLLWVGAAKHG